MAEAGRLSLPAAPAPRIDPVTLVRIAIIVGVLVFWEVARRAPACSIATWCRRWWRSGPRW